MAKSKSKSSSFKWPFNLTTKVVVVGLFAIVGAYFLGNSLAAPGGGKSSGTVSYAMLTDNNGNGTPNFGDTITFNVTSTVAKPSVSLTCYQNGQQVYVHFAGFYPEFPWPQSQNYQLQSGVWTGGAADCNASLYYVNKRGVFLEITSIAIHVDA